MVISGPSATETVRRLDWAIVQRIRDEDGESRSYVFPHGGGTELLSSDEPTPAPFGVLQLLEVAEIAGESCLIYEDCAGIPLDRFVRERQPSFGESVELIGRICSTVERFHANFQLHGCLEAASILVARDGTVRIADFQASRYFPLPFVSPTRRAECFRLRRVLAESFGGQVADRLPLAPQTVGDIPEGLRRETVVAPPPRRWPRWVAVAASLAVVVSIGSSVTARRGKRLDHATARRIVEEKTVLIASTPGALDARSTEFREATDALEDLAESSDTLDQKIHLAVAFQKFGELLGQPLRANLGDTDAAEHYHRRALSILNDLVMNWNESRAVRENRALVLDRLGSFADRRKQWDDGERHYSEAMREYRALFEKFNDSESTFRFAWARIRLGNHFFAVGDMHAASLWYRAAHEVVEPARRRFPEDRFARAEAVCWDSFAAVESDPARAVEFSERAGSITAELTAKQPDDLHAQRFQANQFMNFAIYLTRVDRARARASFEKSINIYLTLLRTNPSDAETRRDLETAQTLLFEFEQKRGHP